MDKNIISNISIVSTVLLLAVGSGVMAEWRSPVTGETITESWQRYVQEKKLEEIEPSWHIPTLHLINWWFNSISSTLKSIPLPSHSRWSVLERNNIIFQMSAQEKPKVQIINSCNNSGLMCQTKANARRDKNVRASFIFNKSGISDITSFTGKPKLLTGKLDLDDFSKHFCHLLKRYHWE